MRIISGKYRGKHILPPAGFNVRPTTDFAKESLFNILTNSYDFEEIRVLDLFSGTGGISYEFASRRCPAIDAIEINPQHVAFIKRMAKELKFDQLHVIRNDAFKFLDFCKATYDIIFADPPYVFDSLEPIPNIVFTRNLLNKDGMLIVEHSDNNDFSTDSHFIDRRHYGGVNFSFFK
ncbi:MAG: RsmD family RNA methyltransferase [Prevotellaceae bacterium]|jgi:16S rRNA (guanine(966)-N(2))-methyltransferase RsmD|nr:RsmD family RNA methyltransferase [Prevotellaceae bacterium]